MRRLVGALLLGALTALGHAQMSLGFELPPGTVLTVSHEAISFDLREQPFPPPQFPAYYYPTAPSEPLELRIFSNIEGGWLVEAELLEGFLGEAGRVIPADQLEYRLDGGPWLEMGPRVVLLTGQDPTFDYQVYSLDLRLRLVGNEAPGTYRGVLNLGFSQF